MGLVGGGAECVLRLKFNAELFTGRMWIAQQFSHSKLARKGKIQQTNKSSARLSEHKILLFLFAWTPFFMSWHIGVSGPLCSCCTQWLRPLHSTYTWTHNYKFVRSTTVTPSVQSLILNRQIYNKMEINGTQAYYWVVCYQWKPPGPAMAPIATRHKGY